MTRLTAVLLISATLAGCTAEERRAFLDGVPEGTAPRITRDVASGDYTDAIVAGVISLVLGTGSFLAYKFKKRRSA